MLQSVPEWARILHDVDADRSFLKALMQTNSSKQIIHTTNIIKFIEDNIDNEDTETLHLIESNLLYLSTYLSNFRRDQLDGGHVSVPALHIDARRKGELLWLHCNLHILIMNIINKHTNTKWMNLNNGRHAICIYLAITIMKNLLLGQSNHVYQKIVTDTDIVYVALQILNCKENEKNITWMERFACITLMQFLTLFDKRIFVKVLEEYELNIMKLLINECCNCFRLPFFYNNLKLYHKYMFSIMNHHDKEDITKIKQYQDMPTYMRSPFANQNNLTQGIHTLSVNCRLQAIATLRRFCRSKPNILNILFKGITSKYLKRLLQVTMSYMRQGKQSFPPQPNTIDIIVLLSQYRFIAEVLVNDVGIIELLIIGLRSRSRVCEFNYREIVPILYYIVVEHELLPVEYYKDLIIVLNDIKEMEWKNLSLSGIFPMFSLSTMIIKMLKYLFGVLQFEKLNKDNFLCSICHEILKYPHTVKCGHSFCYGCLTLLIGTNSTVYQQCFDKAGIEPCRCPLCRSEVNGHFDRNDSKSAFVLNVSLYNKINSDLIIFVDENEGKKNDDFNGNESEYWKYLQTNHKMGDDTVMKNEFIQFCQFMEKQNKSYKENENITKVQTEEAKKAKQAKVEGNELFKQAKYENALEKYRKALEICPITHKSDRVIYYSNITLTLMKMKNYCHAFRASQSGLIMNPTHIKLLNNGIESLNIFLKCEKNGIKSLHPFLKIGKDNELCENKRSYDIILYQLLWDFELNYLQKKLLAETSTHQQSVIHQQYLRENDQLILKNNKISNSIQNYFLLNFDEYQFLNFIQWKHKVKYEIYNEIKDIIKNSDDSFNVNVLKEKLLNKFNQQNEMFASLITNESEFKVMLSLIIKCLNIDDEGKIIKIIETQNRDTEPSQDIKVDAVKCCDDSIATSCLYKWER